MFRNLFALLIILLLGVSIGVFFTGNVNDLISKFKLPIPEHKEVVSAEVILEKIRDVYKIVVVEGEFSELLSYKKNYYGIDFPGFRKNALLKVHATVSVGYNLDSLQMSLDTSRRSIQIMHLPPPEIIAIDHDVSYYDLREGIFNEFDQEDFNKLQKMAKDTIRNAVFRSNMMNRAREQSVEMVNMLTLFARESGWRVTYGPSVKLPDDLAQKVEFATEETNEETNEETSEPADNTTSENKEATSQETNSLQATPAVTSETPPDQSQETTGKNNDTNIKTNDANKTKDSQKLPSLNKPKTEDTNKGKKTPPPPQRPKNYQNMP